MEAEPMREESRHLRTLLTLIISFVTFFCASSTHAGFTATGNETTIIDVLSTNVDYFNRDGKRFSLPDQPGTIVVQKLNSAQASTTFNYDTVDDPSRGLFRLSQLLTNSTGKAISSLTLTLVGLGSDNPLFYSSGFSPTFASVNMDDPDNVSVLKIGGKKLIKSAAESVTFTLDTPLKAGETLTIHAPVAWTYAGEFTILYDATLVPEPGSLVLWALCGGAATAMTMRRRRRQLPAI